MKAFQGWVSPHCSTQGATLPPPPPLHHHPYPLQGHSPQFQTDNNSFSSVLQIVNNCG